MAMKLNAVEKANDSILRQYNSQIEKSVRQLGLNHTTTQNLINAAVQIFGAGNMKTMKNTRVLSESQLNKNTGEIYGIPQIARNRATLSQTAKAKELRATTQYTRGELKGNYKALYDVSKHYQRAIRRAEQKIRMYIPNYIADLTATEPNAANKYVQSQLTQNVINQQTMYDDLASEIFEAYENAKESGDDTDDFETFARDFHDKSKIDDKRKIDDNDTMLSWLEEQRNKLLREKSNIDRQQENYARFRVDELERIRRDIDNGEFEDIL